MKASPEDRRTVLEHLSSALWSMHDGAPYSDGPGDPWEFVLKEADAAPPSEFDTLVDLLEHPPTEDELRSAQTNWFVFETAVSQYLGAYVVRRPRSFAPVAERLIRDPRVGQAILAGLGDVGYQRDFDSSPYLNALETAMEPPYDEDRSLPLIGALGQATSPRALRLLRRLLDALPPGEVDARRWTLEAMGKVAARLGLPG